MKEWLKMLLKERSIVQAAGARNELAYKRKTRVRRDLKCSKPGCRNLCDGTLIPMQFNESRVGICMECFDSFLDSIDRNNFKQMDSHAWEKAFEELLITKPVVGDPSI